MALETEIKIRIAPDALEPLREHLGPSTSVDEQRNIYMDSSEGFLRRRKEMLRLRHIGNSNRWILCFKGRSKHEDGLFQAAEFEWVLSEHEARAFLDDPTTQETRLSPLISTEQLPCLNRLGELVNQRRSYPLDTGHTLELDETLFPDGTIEAEIEVELDVADVSMVRAHLDTLLASQGLSGEPQTASKFVRFLRKTGQMI